MSEKEKIDEMVRRTYRYFYEDGLSEMGVGLLFAVTGLLLLVWQGIESGSLSGAVFSVGMAVLVFGGVLLVRKVVQELKERITYPRTGYVSYRQGEPSIGRWAVIIAALLLVILGFAFPEALSSMAIAEGGLLLIIMFLLGYRSHVWRFYLAGGVALLLGIAALLWDLGDILGSSLVFGGVGLWLFVGGAITFARYLQQHPAQNQEGAQ